MTSKGMPGGSADRPAGPASRWRRPHDWPLVWRLPVMMAALVLVLAVVLTTLGLRELEKRDVFVRIDVASAFLDTLAGVVEPVVAQGGAVAEMEALLSAAARFKPALRNEAVAACCAAGGEIVITSSYPDEQDTTLRETEAALTDWLAANADLAVGETAVRVVEERSKLLVVQAYPPRNGAPLWLGAAFDLEHEFARHAQLQRAAIAIDISLSVLAALITFFVSRHSLKPIDTLTRALADPDHDLEAIGDAAGPHTEIGRLHAALKSRAEVDARASALARAEGERAREAMLAKLAAGLAHEVRNPVAGMSAAASTLRRYGDNDEVREETIALIERGLQSIDRVAASMLSTYRPPEGKRDLLPADLDDLKTLINPKVRAKRIALEFSNALATPFATNADAVRQIALNLLLNATEATPQGGSVGFEARVAEATLILRVTDGGPGLPDEAFSVLTGEGRAKGPQSRRLGLWLVHQLIDDVAGRIAISTKSDKGTAITITIPAQESETDNA